MRFSRWPVRRIGVAGILLVASLGASLGAAAQATARAPMAAPPARTRTAAPSRPWMNAALPVARRAQLLLAQMTLEEKFWQLYMAPGDPRTDGTLRHGAFGVQLLDTLGSRPRVNPDKAAAERSNAVQRFFVERTRLGIPVVLFEEGLHGLVQGGAPVYTQAIGLAATFDTAVVHRVAAEIGQLARVRGVRMLLAPVVNLARDQRWGRVEETFGEDPWLGAAMGVAYVRGVESNDVVATPKHFVANHGDGGRDSYPVNADRATLEDLYFPPFRDALAKGGARSVMASYNSVNGVPASASRYLLQDVLRREWGFSGVVISDAGGVGGANVLHHTTAGYAESTMRAMRAGLDVIFQGSFDSAPLFWDAFRRGMIPVATIDTAVARVLRLKFSLGTFDHPYVTLNAWGYSNDPIATAAEESLVLLRNERGTLPLGRALKRVLVVDPFAIALPAGGYSSRALDASLSGGLRLALGRGVEVVGTAGVDPQASPWKVVDGELLGSGLRGEYFATPSLSGVPVHVRIDPSVDFTWTFVPPAPGLGTDWYSVRWTGTLDLPVGPEALLAVEGDDGYRLWIDDTLVVDAHDKVSYGRREARRPIGGGRHAVRLEYRQTTGTGRIRLLWRNWHDQDGDMRIKWATDEASKSDAAIIVATVREGEFRDRSSLRLPGRQEELIAAVARLGKPVVVVLVAGGAVITTPWMDQVGAVLWAPYPGDGGIAAIARALTGMYSPAGRLPYTVPRSEGQLPLVYDHLPTGRGDDYVDLTGQPLFPFGYGLSYTTFEYSNLELSKPVAGAHDTVRIRFRLKNTGSVASDEVPQLYVRHETAPTAQPVLALRGFTRVSLKPGESCRVDLPLAVSDLAVRDLDGHRRVVSGNVILYVGASSRDIRLRGILQVAGDRR